MAHIEQHLRNVMGNKLSLMKQKSDIKHKLLSKIEEGNITGQLTTSQRFVELRKRYSDINKRSDIKSVGIILGKLMGDSLTTLPTDIHTFLLDFIQERTYK